MYRTILWKTDVLSIEIGLENICSTNDRKHIIAGKNPIISGIMVWLGAVIYKNYNVKTCAPAWAVVYPSLIAPMGLQIGYIHQIHHIYHDLHVGTCKRMTRFSFSFQPRSYINFCGSKTWCRNTIF